MKRHATASLGPPATRARRSSTLSDASSSTASTDTPLDITHITSWEDYDKSSIDEQKTFVAKALAGELLPSSSLSESFIREIRVAGPRLHNLINKVQETSEKLQETSEELQETAEELQETAEELQETSEKLRETKLELEKSRQETKRMTIMHNLRSGTVAARFRFVQAHGKQDVDALIPWSRPERKVVKKLWKRLRKCEDVCDTAVYRSQKEEALYEPLRIVMQRIAAALDQPLLFKIQYRLEDPLYVPDIVGGPEDYRFFGWSDLFVVVAIKPMKSGSAAYKEGAVEAIEYLLFVNENMPESESYRDRVGIFCDFETIEVFAFEEGNIEKFKRSGRIDLFGNGWKDAKSPTEGFELLCRALNVPVSRGKNVVVNGEEVQVIGSLFDSNDVGVYVISGADVSADENVDVVVKVAKPFQRYARGIVRSEWSKYQQLFGFSDLREFMVPPVPELTVERGFAMHKGQSFMADFESKLKEKRDDVSVEELNWQVLLPAILRMLDAIQALKDHGYLHGDIRPRNIILFQQKACLIDWVTATKLSDWKLALRQGFDDPFWPEENCRAELWDLYGLAYSFLYLASSHKDRKMFAIPNERQALVDRHVSGPEKPNDIAYMTSIMITELNRMMTNESIDLDVKDFRHWFKDS